MGIDPIQPLLVKTSLPMVISMLVQALYNIVDSLFVARIEEDALTAVSLAFSMQNLMIAIAIGTGVGFSALVSKSLGERNFEMANKAANNAFPLYGITYLVFLVMAFTLTEPFFKAQHATDNITQYGIDYMQTVLVFSFGMLLQICLERILLSTGKTLYSMITQATGAIINCIMDPILIFGLLGAPKLGVKGAAMATIFGQIVAAALALYFNIHFNKEIHLSFKLMKLDPAVVRRIYAVGVPSIIMAAIGSVMTFGFNRILMSFTTTAAAVFGAYFKLQSFIFMPIFGINNGMVPIVAYNYGARNKHRVLETIKYAAIYAVAIMLAGLVLFETIPGPLLKFYDASPEMLTIGIPALRIIATHFLIAGASIMMSSSFQALGNGVYSMIVSIMRQLVALLPAAYLLSLTGNLNNIWWSFPIAEIVSFLVCCFFMRKIIRDKLNFEDAPVIPEAAAKVETPTEEA
ncbi:MAG: MATE family efflux transporter [Clostridia bacterium]|nr:MATE family efflux transporter [Clostridia bacterium]MBR1704037.1 MATE family efflux transporter [Clostridia bacterium]